MKIFIKNARERFPGILLLMSLAAVLDLIVTFLHICLCISHLLLELSLQLLLGKAFGFKFMLLLLEIISDLILEHLYIVVEVGLLNSSPIVAQRAHLIREGVDSFSFNAHISVIGISLHIDNSIEYVRIYYSIAYQIDLLQIRRTVADCLIQKFAFLLHLLVSCHLLLMHRIPFATCQGA